MGQKINPIGFRLGTTQGHHSLWFAQPKNYSEGLQEDQNIRNYIKNYVQKNMKTSSGVEGIARIEIQKRIDLIQVIIYMGFPKILIHVTIVMKDISLDESIDTDSITWSQKAKWKKKDTTMSYYDMYSNGGTWDKK